MVKRSGKNLFAMGDEQTGVVAAFRENEGVVVPGTPTRALGGKRPYRFEPSQF